MNKLESSEILDIQNEVSENQEINGFIERNNKREKIEKCSIELKK